MAKLDPILKSRKVNPWLLAALVVAGAWVAFLAPYKRIHSMSAGFADYGLLLNGIARTAQGDPVPLYSIDARGSYLGMHFQVFSLAVSALYRVIHWQHMFAYLTTAVWYAAMLAAGWLVYRTTGSAVFGVLAAIALFTNVYSRRVLYSLHGENPEILLEILALLAWRARRWIPFALCLAVAMSVREDVPLFVGGLSLWLLLDARDAAGRRAAGGVLGLAVVYFALAYFVWMPSYRTTEGGNWQAWLLQERWGRGNTFGAMILDLATHPFDVVKALVNWHVVKLLAGFGFLPLLRPGYFLIACAPPILVLSLSQMADYRLFRYYNAATFLGLLAIGTALGLERLLAHEGWAPGRRRRAALACLVVALVLGALEPPARRYWTDLWWYGLTPASRPFPVTERSRAVIKAIGSYPYGGRTVAAGMYTFIHVPQSLRLSYARDWRQDKPDLIVFDSPTETGITLKEQGEKDVRSWERTLARAGYVRRVLHGRCVIFERAVSTPPPVSGGVRRMNPGARP